MIPSCPVHGTPMRASNKGGGFFCPKKNGDEYCSQKLTAAQAAQQMPTQQTPYAPALAAPPVNGNGNGAGYDGRYHLAAAALNAASTAWGVPGAHEDVASGARWYFAQMEALVKS